MNEKKIGNGIETIDGVSRVSLDGKILREICKSIEILGGRDGLISTINSYKRTMDDDFILDSLKRWNSFYGKKVKDGISNHIYSW